jgi:hypothetical protein
VGEESNYTTAWSYIKIIQYLLGLENSTTVRPEAAVSKSLGLDLAPPQSPVPTPSTSPVSKLDRRQTGRLRKRDNLLTGEGGEGQIIRRRDSLVLYQSFNTF